MKKCVAISALFALVVSCSPMEESEREKLLKINEITEKIYRLEGEHFFHSNEVVVKSLSPYPWEPKSLSVDKKITKEFFRCRGSFSNSNKSLIDESRDKTTVADCSGMEKHGLPYRDEKEFIYPALIELLNYLQEKMGKRVVITTGHRCPTHNTFADRSKKNQYSKHQIGAEVDFYVEGFEESPLEVVRFIMHYYTEHPELDYGAFRECKHNSLGLSHPGWYNKEIIVNIKQKDEGRDFDNRHPYPYVTVEIRCDRSEDDKVVEYNWNVANNCYIRF